ncbi:radical SAM protein [Streptomyces sp. ICBB 8177]|uniref:radical SAM protein n=1 Tax=Streptomyces sp. ICBB 8177 TaxID=563922 RepID=UPI000D6801F6|nr:radical SAM protein [Streptomyces sp. ICBB 8177]PWI45368.1 molybdenum cofactor biosynthesis protein MoaA [Streptomyces sp. ICBB 8177]
MGLLSPALRSPAPAPDMTALSNFAALRGQLRVSLGPACNIWCWFCHNEGDVPPGATKDDGSLRPRERLLCADHYVQAIGGLIATGLRRVYFTGGEPLASRLARPVLEGVARYAAPDVTFALITNGILVPRALPWLQRIPLDKIKVSLHYFSDATFRMIARANRPISDVLAGIESAREAFERVEINTLLQRQNRHEVPAILDYALTRRLPVQFIELVSTDFNTPASDAAVPADDLVALLRTMCESERVEVAGVGQGRRVFTVDGVEVEVIHRELGRHHVGQCGTCPLKPQCVEGFWALRLDHAGGLMPCLLREDLRLHLAPILTARGGLGAAHAVARHVAAFTEGTL